MARLPRLNLPGIPQHIVQRGNNRQACFFSGVDYAVYLDKLREYGQKYHVAVHSYVLMTNHVHLLATPAYNHGVARLIQALGSYYVRYINNTYSRTGTLWEGRYKSTLVDSETYFLTVSRYIELNPVRAKMAEHPAEYPWSSYRMNALGVPIALLTPHDCYLALGRCNQERQDAYQALFDHHIPGSTIEEIRNSINKAWAIGDEPFIQQVEAQTGRRVTHQARGGDRKSEAYRKSK